MNKSSRDLARWSSVPLPQMRSNCEELYDIRADLIFVDSQFAEWLAGGRKASGREFDIIQEEAVRVSIRIAKFRADASDAEQLAALGRYCDRMIRILAGDESGFLA